MDAYDLSSIFTEIIHFLHNHDLAGLLYCRSYLHKCYLEEPEQRFLFGPKFKSLTKFWLADAVKNTKPIRFSSCSVADLYVLLILSYSDWLVYITHFSFGGGAVMGPFKHGIFYLIVAIP